MRLAFRAIGLRRGPEFPRLDQSKASSTAATILCVSLAWAALSGSLAAAQDQPEAGPLAERAAELLVERCASCHAPDSGDRRAIRGWADARDLAATVSDPELLVPGDPDGSWVYLVIEDMEMPPADSDVPQMNEEEQKVIADWIQGGAHLPPTDVIPADEIPLGQPGEEPAEEPAEKPAEVTAREPAPAAEVPWMKRPWPRWLGRFHPILVHFPIALLAAALLAELSSRLLRMSELRPAATFCYVVGALASAPAAGCGWLLAASTTQRGDELDLHRWLGVSVAAVALAGLGLFLKRPGLRLPILFLVAGLSGITGHLGGELVYGEGWLSLPMSADTGR